MKLFISLIFLLFMHPVHITLTNIEYNKKDNDYDLVFKVYSDDFEKIINSIYSCNLTISSNESIEKNKTNISNYFRKNFNISINKKSLIDKDFLFYKHESNFEAHWFYFKLKKQNKKPNNVTIINRLMNTMYSDQKNLTFFKTENIEEAMFFNNTTIIKELELK